jgi:hypothetical protein
MLLITYVPVPKHRAMKALPMWGLLTSALDGREQIIVNMKIQCIECTEAQENYF